MHVRAAIFDLDGPILDSFRDGLRRIRTICAIHDIPFGREEHRRLTQLWGKPGVELLMEGLGIGERIVRETLYPAWERLDIQQPNPLVPRAREVFAWLRRNKILSTLLTSRHREHVEELLDRLDLLTTFAVVSTKFDALYQKPDPRVFQYTLDRLWAEYQITKRETIFVGDTPADVDAGVAAKMGATLLVQTGPYLLKHADKLPLVLSNILNSIDDVPGWIEENHDGPLTSYD